MNETRKDLSNGYFEMEHAKEMMRGLFMPDYDEEDVDHQILWMQVTDELGIYPASTVNRDGKETFRTEWQDGWNEAIIKATKRMCELLHEKKAMKND